MSLNFLSPIYLLGALGISIPVLIHLLTRRQQKHIKFSAVYLLLQSQKRSVKKSKPNRLLLLLIRCLGIVLLSLALAGPIITFGPSDDFASSNSTAIVFILDDSYSMNARSEKGTLYDQAVGELLELTERLSGESAYSIVMASTPSRVLLNWTHDPESARKFLKGSSPSYATTRIGGALKKAYALLETAKQTEKRIFILTDRDANGWAEEAFPDKNAGRPVPVAIVDYSGRQSQANDAAVESAEVRQEFLSNSRVLRIKTTIANLSASKSVNRINASVWVNGKRMSESLLDLKPGSVEEKEFSLPLLENESMEGIIQLQEDGLETDNQRYFTYHADQAISVLVVDGDPRTVEHQSESFYLERALNPFTTSVTNMDPIISTLPELPERNLYDFSVVMLCNIRELPLDYEQKLEKFVLRGGALFISLGDQVDPRFYNERLKNLVPVTLETLLRTGAKDVPFHLLLDRPEHPVLKIFSPQTLEEMKGIEFTSIYDLKPREGQEIKIPLRFSNQSPALIEYEVGKGKVLLFASSLDRDWNNFPIQPTFLPWTQRWIKYSARGLESITRQNLLVNEPFEWTDELFRGQVYIQTPGGKIISLPAPDGKIRFEETHQPGVYKLFQEAQAPQAGAEEKSSTEILRGLPENALPGGTFTVNIDTRESAPGKISDEKIHVFLNDAPVRFLTNLGRKETPETSEGFPMAAPFLLLLAGMLLYEGWMVRRE